MPGPAGTAQGQTARRPAEGAGSRTEHPSMTRSLHGWLARRSRVAPLDSRRSLRRASFVRAQGQPKCVRTREMLRRSRILTTHGGGIGALWRLVQANSGTGSTRGTDGSNPSPSSKESSNFRFLSGGRIAREQRVEIRRVARDAMIVAVRVGRAAVVGAAPLPL